MSKRHMDLETVEEIARDPSAATPRQLRDAWFFTRAHVDRSDEEENALLPWERRRFEAAQHCLAIHWENSRDRASL